MNNVMGEQASWILQLPTKVSKPGPEAFHPMCGRVHRRRDCSLVEVERTLPSGRKRVHLVPESLVPKRKSPRSRSRARKH